MPRNLSAAANNYTGPILWLAEITTRKGNKHYFAEDRVLFGGITYQPYLRVTEGPRFTRSLRADAAEIELLNADLFVGALLQQEGFEGALCDLQQFFLGIEQAVLVFRGRLTEQEEIDQAVRFRLVSELDPAQLSVHARLYAQLCTWRFRQKPCGYLPDQISVTENLAERTADIFSAATIGAPFQPLVTVAYLYDKNGNRLTMDDGVLGITNYVPDLLNRPTSITAPGQAAITLGYDALSRRTCVTRPNGVDSTLLYDPASRLTSIVHGAIASFTYGHDALSNRDSLAQTRAALTVAPSLTFAYDAIDQVTSATHPLPANPVETFTYDSLGNRLLRDGQVTNSVFDAANRLLDDEDFTYIYDANGNLETKTDKFTSAVTTYGYDAENRLIQIDFPDLTFAAYRYDGLGRRIEKNVNGVITRYLYDAEDILLEYDGTNTLLARYTHGPGIDDPLVMERDLDASGTFEATERFAYHTDGLGSVTELTDSTGVVVRAYAFDAFGQIADEIGTLANPYAYTGREFDAESGLYFYRARYYDAETGRFLVEDPIGFAAGDVNLYRYVFNNPTNLTDPSGLAVCIAFPPTPFC
ncbi:MAG: DUF2163 domain-containing protein, partial [Acidobacteria bacterium]|nr:DUF2163 domain-containing protein [Acidobacteriota bacterium]